MIFLITFGLISIFFKRYALITFVNKYAASSYSLYENAGYISSLG